jgi:hypothetical protein
MFMTAVSLGLTCTVFADNYSDLARLRGFEGYVNRKSFKINASA